MPTAGSTPRATLRGRAAGGRHPHEAAPLALCRLAVPLLAGLLLGGCSGGTPGREPGPLPGSGAGALPAGGALSEVELRRLLDRLRAEAGAPGALLGVDTGTGPPLVVASGLADRETGRPMPPDVPYFIGSATKTYTAVVVLRLAEEGRLALDDTVARFLPSFPGGAKITIRHLLAHTSGLKDFYSHFYYRPDRAEMIDLVTRQWSQEELLGYAGRFGHWFEPGTDWAYSNVNYFLLGVIAKRASGLSLPAAYRRYIYEPLGLRRTWLAWHEEPLAAWPTGYMGPVAEWKHSEMFGQLGATTLLDRSSAEWAAGGLVAPAGESLRFLRGLLAGELLSPASLAAMTRFRDTPPLGAHTPNAASGETKDGYGLGLIRIELAGFTLLGHGGLFNGHTAGMWHAPDCGVTIALYVNRGFIDVRALLAQVVSAVCAGERARPAPADDGPQPPTPMSRSRAWNRGSPRRGAKRISAPAKRA